MSTISMHILIGRACQFHGGVNPTHALTLRENGRAELHLRAIAQDAPDIHWITAPEQIVENALLMVALHVCGIPELKELAAHFRKLKPAPEHDLSGAGASKKLRPLHRLCRKLFPARCKLVITVCDQSSARQQLPVLKDYPMEVEVCTPEFQRLWNSWSKEDDKMETLGTFYKGVMGEPPPPPASKEEDGDDLRALVIRRAHGAKRRDAVRRVPQAKRRKK